MMKYENETLLKILYRVRELTDGYTSLPRPAQLKGSHSSNSLKWMRTWFSAFLNLIFYFEKQNCNGKAAI